MRDDDITGLINGLLDDATEAEQWPEPDQLRRPLPPAEIYPVQALGPILGAAAEAISGTVQAPMAVIAGSLLAAASVAVMPHADVRIDGRTIPLSLWIVSVADSGERKSAVDALALEAHRRVEKDRAKAYTEDRAEFDLLMEEYSAEQTKRKKAPAKSIDDPRLEPPEPPLLPWLISRDPTVEGLHKLLAAGRGYAGLLSDDGGDFLGGFAMSRENRTRTAAALSSLWDRGEFDRVRGGDGANKYWGRRLALHLLIQPVIAESVLSDRVLCGQGFLARCLLSWPQGTAGTRRYVERDLSTDGAMQTYWRRMSELLNVAPRLADGTRNELDPRPLTLAHDAKALWVKMADAIELSMSDAGNLFTVKAWASKAPEQILRIAGVLTMVEDPRATEISKDAIERAGEIVAFHLGEAARLIGTASVPPQIRNAEAILAWAQQRGKRLIHSREILRLGPNCVREADAMRAAMAVLERHGWVRPLPAGTMVDGKNRQTAWEVWHEDE